MAETTPISTPAKKSSKKTVPTSDSHLRPLAETVLKSWQASALTLPWITKEAFANQVAAYGQALDTSKNTTALNKPDQLYVKTVNTKINTDIKYIKGYLKDTYEENDIAYYAEFGIVLENSTYRLPSDPDERGKALQQLLTALSKHGLDTKKFGTAHWKKINDDYTSLVTNVSEKKKTVTASTNTKNEIKEEVRLVLQSLTHLLKAAYPKTWENVMQEWGF